MRATLAGVNYKVQRKINRESLEEKLNPDIPIQKALPLLGCIVVEVICILTKLILRMAAIRDASEDSVTTMLAVDTVKYCAMLSRNVMIFNFVVQHHRQLANRTAFTIKNILHDSTLGRQSEVCVEVFMLLALGSVFQAMAFAQLVQTDPVSGNTTTTSAGYGTATTGFVWISQLVQFSNYVSLVALFAPLDNAHDQIKTVCQLCQFSQLAEICYDISLHIIYSVSLDYPCAHRLLLTPRLQHSQTGTDAAGLKGVKGSGSGSESYHDLRLASLVAFISGRVIAQRFFGEACQTVQIS